MKRQNVLVLKYSLLRVISSAYNYVTFNHFDLTTSCCEQIFFDSHIKQEDIFKQITFQILRHGQEWSESIVESIKSVDPANSCDSMI